MTIGLIGRKCGMTRIFKDSGESIPVSVIEVSPNSVTQIKTDETDGYTAIQICTGVKKANKINKAEAGHFAKADVAAGKSLCEFRLNDVSEITVGQQFNVDHFNEGETVDVTGKSKGKGFAGVIKRYNFKTQDATHGNSLAHRAPGSIGQNQTPGRVFKGKKMAGHMGAEKCTVQNLEVIKVDKDRNLLLIRGAIPGAPGGEVIIKSAVKHDKGDK